MTSRWKLNQRTGRTIPSEHAEQAALIQWAEMVQTQRPELGRLYAIPNGGKRSLQVALALKREGLKAGVPDLCLAVARSGYHALYIEIKAQDGKLSLNQKRWRDNLIAGGYGVAVAHGFDSAREIIEDYLDDKWRQS